MLDVVGVPTMGFVSGSQTEGNWYIYRVTGYNEELQDLKVEYMHKDRTWHSYCGRENLWIDKPKNELGVFNHMFECERCGEDVSHERLHQCWRFHLSKEVMDKYKIRDGGYACPDCYKYYESKKHTIVPPTPEDFIDEEEMRI